MCALCFYLHVSSYLGEWSKNIGAHFLWPLSCDLVLVLADPVGKNTLKFQENHVEFPGIRPRIIFCENWWE